MSKFGLTLRKKEEPKAVQRKSKAAIFEQDSDEEEEKDQSASAKFQRKYANLEKSKDKRMVEKMMAENPDIYDYDGQYEKMQKIKDQKIAEQKEADKDKKPKYAHKIMEAHKKRELEKLLHDEHTYKKEREQEAGEFDDKEVFVTGAYRKQIEERNKFREEIEEQDRMDEMRDVKNQSMWQQAFQRKMLEDRARDYQMDEEKEEAKVKMEPLELKTETEEIRTKNELVEKEVKREEMEEPIKKRRREEGEQPPPQQQEYKERHHGDRQRRRSRSPKTGTGETEFEPEEKKVQKKSQHLALLPPLDDLTEEVRRMEIIRQILRKRNGPKEVEEARNRYLERREADEIKPPF